MTSLFLLPASRQFLQLDRHPAADGGAEHLPGLRPLGQPDAAAAAAGCRSGRILSRRLFDLFFFRPPAARGARPAVRHANRPLRQGHRRADRLPAQRGLDFRAAILEPAPARGREPGGRPAPRRGLIIPVAPTSRVRFHPSALFEFQLHRQLFQSPFIESVIQVCVNY